MTQTTHQVSRRLFMGAGGALATASGLSTLVAATESTAARPARFSGVSVSLIADSLRKIGHNPMELVMTPDIKPLVNVGETVIGPAVTTKWEVTRGKGNAGDIRRFVFRPLDEAAAGSVWVVASGTEQILSMFGDVIARACLRNGLVGAITDSGCRDIKGMQAIGFPVFGKASVPYGPGNIIRPVAANVPVTCGKVEVHPGDLVAADSDGVIVVPKGVIDGLGASIMERSAHEKEMRRKIDEGESLEQAYSL